MKKIVKNILYYFSRFIAIIWSHSVSVKYRLFLLKLHSFWITPEFKSLGSSYIGYPIVLKGGKYISIGDNTGLGKRGVLTAWDTQKDVNYNPCINIGNNVSIGEDYHITAINRIETGNNVLMGKKITITDNSHGKTEFDEMQLPPIQRPWFSKGPVIIEDNVWIGDKATILAGITIGKNSIIGANAVVTKNVQPFTIVGGNPAKIIKIC